MGVREQLQQAEIARLTGDQSARGMALVAWADARRELKDFNPRDHPRWPGGNRGGQFRPKTGGQTPRESSATKPFVRPPYQDIQIATDPSKQAPLYDLAMAGKSGYGSDIYGPRGRELYGSGEARLEEETWRQIRRARGNPDAPVTIYRAVPEHASEINPGDYVTLSHAEADNFTAMLGGRVVKKRVKAKDVRAVSDYTHEWGYFPGAGA